MDSVTEEDTLTSALVDSMMGRREFKTSGSKSPKSRSSYLYAYGASHKWFSKVAVQITKSATLSITVDLAHSETVTVRINATDVSLGNLKAAALTGLHPNFTKVLKLALLLPAGTTTT